MRKSALVVVAVLVLVLALFTSAEGKRRKSKGNAFVSYLPCCSTTTRSDFTRRTGSARPSSEMWGGEWKQNRTIQEGFKKSRVPIAAFLSIFIFLYVGLSLTTTQTLGIPTQHKPLLEVGRTPQNWSPDTFLLSTLSFVDSIPSGPIVLGESSDRVYALQSLLLAGGVPISLTTSFGVQSQAFLKRFQKSQRIPITGMGDRATLRAVIKKATSTPQEDKMVAESINWLLPPQNENEAKWEIRADTLNEKSRQQIKVPYHYRRKRL